MSEDTPHPLNPDQNPNIWANPTPEDKDSLPKFVDGEVSSGTKAVKEPRYGVWDPNLASANVTQDGYGQFSTTSTVAGENTAPNEVAAPSMPASTQSWNQGGFGFAPAVNIQPGIIPLRPLSISDIINGIFLALRSAPAVFVGFPVLIWSLISAFSSLLIWLFFPNFISLVTLNPAELATQNTMPLDKQVLNLIPMQLFSAFFTTIIIMVLYAMFSDYIFNLVKGTPLNFSNTLKSAGKQKVPLILSGFLLYLSYILLLSVFAVILTFTILIGVSADSVAVTVVSALVMFLIIMALAFVFLYLLTRLLFAIPALLHEHLSFSQAIKRSWQLSKGSFWRLTGLNLLTTLILAALTGLLSLFTSIITAVMLLMQVNEMLVFLVTLSISSIITGGLSALLPIAWSLAYIDSLIRKEGYALKLLNQEAKSD